MSREEMQRLLDLMARNGKDEWEAVQALMQVIGIHYNKALQDADSSDKG